MRPWHEQAASAYFVRGVADRRTACRDDAYHCGPSNAGRDRAAGGGRRPLEDAADPSVLYLHTAGKKSLRFYAGGAVSPGV